MTTHAGGLGRGLSTILTGASTAPPPEETPIDRLIGRALTEMASRGPLRLCGHLDDLTGEAALTLRSPDLGSLHPTEAYELFRALSRIDARAPGRHDLDIGSHRALAVVIDVDGRRGMWFFGDDRADEPALERLAQIAEAYGPAIGDLRRSDPADDLVAVDLDGSDATWSARVRWPGSDGPVEGAGAGTRALDAAAAAVMDAMGIGAAGVHVESIAADAVGLVTAVIDLGPLQAVGAATVPAASDDTHRTAAAAVAARRAGKRLSPRRPAPTPDAGPPGAR